MVEIANKIESIRNMRKDLHSIKLMSQENADKMLQHLANFRNQICNEMSQIEHNYQTGRNRRQTIKRTSNHQENLTLDSVSGYDESEDAKRMGEMMKKWENYSLMDTDVSASLTSTHNGSNDSQTIEEYSSSADTSDSISSSDKVKILFSKQLPYKTPDSPPIGRDAKNGIPSNPSGPLKTRLENATVYDEDTPITPDKIDKLTKKLKEIQTQNEELQNANENIKNLLLKLSDLKYADVEDAETMDKLDTVKKETQSSSDIAEMIPETVLKTESYQQFTRSVEITSK